MNNPAENTDPYLDLFSATHTVTTAGDNEIHEVSLSISDNIIAEIHLPKEIADNATSTAMRFMVLERMEGDIMEGVVTALKKADDAYPTYEEYKVLKEMSAHDPD